MVYDGNPAAFLNSDVFFQSNSISLQHLRNYLPVPLAPNCQVGEKPPKLPASTLH